MAGGKTRVPVAGTIGKAVFIDPNATVGSQIGTDFKLPDGTVPTLAQLAAALGVNQQAAATFAATLWQLIGEIPINIVDIAALRTSGFLVRNGDGSWSLVPAPPPGQIGLDGSDGAEGDRGPPGAPGAAGAAGLRGPPGEDGQPGDDGSPGPPGPPGATGTGTTGAPGPMGNPGVDGSDGADGNDGPPGPQGPAGSNGATGAAGPFGPPGPEGEAGADGGEGPPGPQGIAGPAGLTGSIGPQGPIGLIGQDGADGTDGDRGAPGVAGANGATGPQGPIGIPGNDGDTGADGDRGAPGAQGLQGVTGAQGAIGSVITFGDDAAPEIDYCIGRGVDQMAPYNWGGNHVWNQSINGDVVNTLRNSSAGVAADGRWRLLNDAGHDFSMFLTSSAYSGLWVTGGPSGEQCGLYSNQNIPFVFGVNNAARLIISAAGNIYDATIHTFKISTVEAITISGVATTGTSTPSFGAVANKPGATSGAQVAKWLPVTLGGVQFYMPMWAA